MPALLSIDEELFRFINLKLANPFFDVLMPFLSGNKLFGPAIVAIAALLIWRGGAKGRCYLLLLALLLSAGDPLVCNSFKNYFQRPRPFVTLPDARRPGKTPPSTMVATPAPAGNTPRRTSYGMPSAHAFNWGAAAAITFLFYRRSWRFMVPMAFAVAYSRVYNGVHYPGDVLVGLLLGSVYGFSGVVALNALWGWFGKMYFPLWWARLGNLVNPVVAPAPAVVDARTVNRQWIRVGWLLIVAVFIARLFYLASGTILLSEDEAYQWLWSKHLAWSYYSKPFGIALAQWIGTSLWGDTAFGVRFLSPVMAAVLGLMLLHFLARHASGRTAFFFVLICLATPLIAVGGIMITIDPLVVFFWTLAMLAAWNAITRDSTGWWLAAGVGMSGAFLSKYISPFQWASFALFFLLCKPARAQLRRPGPWLALGINLLATAPVILWNQQHNWITMTHLKQRGDLGRAWHPTLKYFGEFLGAELGLLNIVFAVAVVWAVVAFLRSDFKRRASAPPAVTLELFLLCQGIVVFGFYTLYTFHSRVQPNWIAAGVLPLFLFATLWWHRRWQSGDRKPARFLAAGLALGLPLVLFAHNTDLIGKLFHKPLPAKLDILHRVRGYDEMARIVGGQRQLLLAEGKPVFIIADNYSRAGELSFYLTEARPLVATDHPLITINKTEHPGNQLWFWPGYDFANRTGQNAIYIDETDDRLPAPDWLKAEFASVTDLGLFDINYRGRVYDRIQLFACRGKK
jgi:membrane-associated phospholipid phosphatase